MGLTTKRTYSIASRDVNVRLTRKQAEVLEFIRRHPAEQGFPATVREVARAFGLRSVKAAFDHIKALERKGLLRRRPRCARGLEVLGAPLPGVQVVGVAPAGLPGAAEEVPGEWVPLPPGAQGQEHETPPPLREDPSPISQKLLPRNAGKAEKTPWDHEEAGGPPGM